MKIRFGIRHLLIAVALFAILFGWIFESWRVVNERKTIVNELNRKYPTLTDSHLAFEDKPEIPWMRRLLGDEYYGIILTSSDASEELIARATKYFEPRPQLQLIRPITTDK